MVSVGSQAQHCQLVVFHISSLPFKSSTVSLCSRNGYGQVSCGVVRKTSGKYQLLTAPALHLSILTIPVHFDEIMQMALTEFAFNSRPVLQPVGIRLIFENRVHRGSHQNGEYYSCLHNLFLLLGAGLSLTYTLDTIAWRIRTSAVVIIAVGSLEFMYVQTFIVTLAVVHSAFTELDT
jgi:hypothetical protein